MIETWAHRAVGLALVAVLVAFADTPARTLGQRYTRNRWAERLVLLSIEMNLVLLWALFVPFAHRDLPLAAASAAVACALAGALLALAGAALAVAAKFGLGAGFTATLGVKQGHVLVTTGAYAVVRHPIYTGLLGFIAGAAVAWRSGGTLVLALALAVPFALHTLIEEPLLVEAFGDAYRDYQRRVPRLLPFIPMRGRPR